MGTCAHGMTVVSIAPRQRAAVLAAAREAFARRGFMEACLHEIAQRARLSLGLVLSYFKSKKDLFNAVVDQVWSEALARLEAAVEEARTPEEKFQTFIQLRQGLAERMVRELGITPAALRDLLPLVTPRLAGPRAREVALLESIFEEGLQRGTFTFTERGPRAAARVVAEGLQNIECAMVRFCLTPGALRETKP